MGRVHIMRLAAAGIDKAFSAERGVFMKKMLVFVIITVTGAFFSNFAVAQQTDNVPAYTEIAQIFDQRCVSCHSGARPPEGLRLDNYKNVMAGAKGGPVILPGKPSESRLVKSIRGLSKPRMPKNGPPWLTDVQMDLIERWISALPT
jgi:mono/diheme cytochrome c family protein